MKNKISCITVAVLIFTFFGGLLYAEPTLNKEEEIHIEKIAQEILTKFNFKKNDYNSSNIIYFDKFISIEYFSIKNIDVNSGLKTTVNLGPYIFIDRKNLTFLGIVPMGNAIEYMSDTVKKDISSESNLGKEIKNYFLNKNILISIDDYNFIQKNGHGVYFIHMVKKDPKVFSCKCKLIIDENNNRVIGDIFDNFSQ